MIWLTWRQFRAQALTAVALLAAAASYLLITGLQMHRAYAAALASCTLLNDCDSSLSQFQQNHTPALHLGELLVMTVPALIGMFWGAPLIGRELETGTDELVWNQTVTRTRWLTAKLTIVGLASIATVAICSSLLTWWAGPLDSIAGDRFTGITFATRDIAPIGYAAFAFALGTTAGLLLRRVVPAMALTLAVFIGIQILVPTLIRPNLLHSTTVTFTINGTTASQISEITMNNGGAEIHMGPWPVPQGAWVISAPPIKDSAGRVVAAHDHPNCFPSPGAGASAIKSEGPAPNQIAACLAEYDLQQSLTYQPASHYWPLQWYETAMFLAVAGLLSGFCFWWIRRRQS
jgi:ABC-type transport system involved in multi-copper enzyme maturation permease subunit